MGTKLFLKNSSGQLLKNSSGQFLYKALPNTYQEVEYIQSSGTQCINTGINFSSGTSAEMIFMLVEKVTSGSADMLAVYNAPKTYFFHQYNGGCGWGYNGTYHGADISYDIDIKYNLFCSLDDGNQIFKLNGTTNRGTATGSYTNTYNLYLFAANHDNAIRYPTKAKLYSCKLWTNNILVRDFVPCYRKSDNIIGLYDLVNGVFYTNSGSGSFTKGPNV